MWVWVQVAVLFGVLIHLRDAAAGCCLCLLSCCNWNTNVTAIPLAFFVPPCSNSAQTQSTMPMLCALSTGRPQHTNVSILAACMPLCAHSYARAFASLCVCTLHIPSILSYFILHAASSAVCLIYAPSPQPYSVPFNTQPHSPHTRPVLHSAMCRQGQVARIKGLHSSHKTHSPLCNKQDFVARGE